MGFSESSPRSAASELERSGFPIFNSDLFEFSVFELIVLIQYCKDTIFNLTIRVNYYDTLFIEFIILTNQGVIPGELDKEETNIIEGIRSGRETVFQLLFEKYYPKLVVFAVKYLDDRETARDIVQDALLHLYESRQSITIQTSLKSYLYSTVKNRCMNYIKHRQVRERHREMITRSGNGLDPDLNEKMDATELEARIHEIVSRLPEQCRRIYFMSRVEGKRNREISGELNLSIRTVETQISRALK